MDFFKGFQKRDDTGSAPKKYNPDKLRDVMRDALQKGNKSLFISLCQKERDTIRENFDQWRKVPENIRPNPALMNSYAQFLITLARSFDEALGIPDLLNELKGTAEDNPILKWQHSLQLCQQLTQSLRYEEALNELEKLLISFEKMKGPAVDQFLPITIGFIAECYFQKGQPSDSVLYQEKALTLCQERGDMEGVVAYSCNLYEIYRYLGQGQKAAEYGELLISAYERFGNVTEAEKYRGRLHLVREGEPLVRVTALLEGMYYEIEDVPEFTGKNVQFLYERNRITLRRAEHLTAEGIKRAEEGHFEEALPFFSQSAVIDSYAPEPWYHQGNTFLYLKRYADAVESFQEVEKRAPAWYHSIADSWLAIELSRGTIPHELFLTLRELEDMQSPVEKCRRAMTALRGKVDFAPLYLFYGDALLAISKKDEALEAYKKGLTCSPDRKTQTDLLLKSGTLEGDPRQKHKSLQEAAGLRGNLVSSAMAYLLLKEGRSQEPPQR